MINKTCEVSCDEMYCDVCHASQEGLSELEYLRVKQAFSLSRLNNQKNMCSEIETRLKELLSLKKRAYETLGMELIEYNSYTEKIRELEGGKQCVLIAQKQKSH